MQFAELEKWLFPPTCVLTGAPSLKFDLGEEALLQLKSIVKGCRCCGRPLPEALPPHSLCGQCLPDPPAFDETVAGFIYETVMRELILRYKFHPEPHLSRLLFELFYSIRQQSLHTLGVEAIIPMPNHPNRLLERGFNSALEIAKPLAKVLRVPLLPFAVQRIKDTPPQSSLALEKRKQNIKGAFQVQPEYFQGVHSVLLVDDVMTTGHSLNALAEVIKAETEVQYIVNAVMARGVKDSPALNDCL